ncbi:MAG: glycerophosphodiester phosphodiesterase [Acidimicrobiia bacterium]|nr:glycerophosphodiester phosphodiesterase [Acidimicrobiia bacterium]
MLTLASDRFLVFGHRGASAHAPENTVAAFQLAAEQEADGVELDVRRTADGALVVHHDATFPGLGPIVDHTEAELRRHAPSLATFPEAMAACEGLIVNIEIKNSPLDPDFDPDDTVAAAVVAWVDDSGWTDRVVISSFNAATVDFVRRSSGTMATGQLIDAGGDAVRQLLAANQRGHQALHPHITSLIDTQELAAIANGLDMWLLAWTVDDPDTIRSLRDAGITGVITNDPARAVAALA